MQFSRPHYVSFLEVILQHQVSMIFAKDRESEREICELWIGAPLLSIINHDFPASSTTCYGSFIVCWRPLLLNDWVDKKCLLDGQLWPYSDTKWRVGVSSSKKWEAVVVPQWTGRDSPSLPHFTAIYGHNLWGLWHKWHKFKWTQCSQSAVSAGNILHRFPWQRRRWRDRWAQATGWSIDWNSYPLDSGNCLT